MSDISSDSSFDLLSDSDHSDVEKPSVVFDQLKDHNQNKDHSIAVEPKVFDKSPIESDGSANNLQNTDHLDVVEPKIMETEAIGPLRGKTTSDIEKSNLSDINKATDHSENDDLLNTSHSNVVEPKVVEAKAPDVLIEQKPISPKKSTWNRRQSIHSDIKQSSNADDNNLLSEETKKKIQADAIQAYCLSEERRKLHEQKLADANIFLLGCFLLMICFLVVIGACVFLSGPSSVQHNTSPTVKKCNVITKKVYNFHKEKKQKVMDEIERARKINEIQRSYQGKTDVNQLPEYLWNKFIPDFSRFKGVDDFLQLTQTKETIVEDYLYYSLPRFQIKKGILYIRFVDMDTLENVEAFRIEDCVKFAHCHSFDWFMKNGDLYIKETFVLNSEEYKFTRVYFIPPHEMI